MCQEKKILSVDKVLANEMRSLTIAIRSLVVAMGYHAENERAKIEGDDDLYSEDAFIRLIQDIDKSLVYYKGTHIILDGGK